MLPLLIEPEELEAHLEDDNLLIVDLCRTEIYQQQHIPGAVHVPPGAIVSGVQPAVGRLPELDRLNAVFSAIGYSADKHIVAYDDEGGGWAGRFIWTLDVIGHSNASMVNGGLIAWANEGRPMTTEVPTISPAVTDLQINRDVIAEKEDILKGLDSGDLTVWDARSAEEWAGTKVVAAKGGHIPGAINVDWLLTMDRDRQLRLREDIQSFLAAQGIDGKKPIITHCQSHHRSGLTYFIGKYLGFDIRGYHGSWSEWGNDPDTPVE